MNQVPAYLQNRQSRQINERAMAMLGTTLPPHISIQGNTFTLIDAAGNEQDAGNVLDACVYDVSDVACKMYFGGKKWEPDSKDPPLCWSSNGQAPSREAIEPQARTCAECPQNVRGSATSAISGAAIKACRDEQWLALGLPKFPQLLFKLVVTPGSFKNWKAYLEVLKNGRTDVSDVMTQITFMPKVNGVLQFKATAYIDQGTYELREKATAQKATDVLVGRNDVPREGLPPPAAQQQIAPPAQDQGGTPFGGAPFAGVPLTPTATVTAPTPAMNAASPSEAPARRKRRTAAEMAAANAAPVPTGSPVAPFRPQSMNATGNTGSPFAQPQPNGAQFGIAQPSAPPADLTNALNSVFGKQP